MPAVASRGRGRRTINEINMVPFIDVMLVLLIIFMVTATVITPGVINIPSAGKSTRAPDKRVDVLVDGKGDISLAGELQTGSVTETEAVDKIKQLLKDNPDMPVMLAADSDLQYKQVMGIMRKLREAGVLRVGLSVK
ncbi:biopolymer transporter ExbD [Ottowia sp.]|uniref:ExbD/TolR family protein n=1 Tax=Ottowia sp. TaxID=1898956 RepID=UPI002B7A1910|nr:biopolymer transporter ExbD [Ottowia sp.]MCP5258587.1 biopolymer transporter ExbD [Burkholderiaceae bacterium]HPK31614.1 biopolymer transporter ExbD [Ottowia sp.]HPR44370.1 biopolymer transporter ExbD [Ottowia sp.]HRW73926.1 biopolymer transporter ExbD [Ottowia sp.]